MTRVSLLCTCFRVCHTDSSRYFPLCCCCCYSLSLSLSLSLSVRLSFSVVVCVGLQSPSGAGQLKRGRVRTMCATIKAATMMGEDQHT